MFLFGRSLRGIELGSVILATSILGCHTSGSATYPVRGVVRFEDGSPVKSGIVEFESVEKGINARAEIKADGSFRLRTGDQDGVIAGQHRAVILQPFLYAGVTPIIDKSSVPHRHSEPIKRVAARYSSYTTSQLKFTVEPQKDNVIEIVTKAEK